MGGRDIKMHEIENKSGKTEYPKQGKTLAGRTFPSLTLIVLMGGGTQNLVKSIRVLTIIKLL